MVTNEEKSSPKLGFLEFFVLTIATATMAVPLILNTPPKRLYKENKDFFNEAVTYCQTRKADNVPESYGTYSGMRCSELELKVDGKKLLDDLLQRKDKIYFQ